MFKKMGLGLFLALLVVVGSTFGFKAAVPVANADHSATVQIFLTPLQEVYMPNDVVAWGMICHVDWSCTISQDPGMLSGFNVDTSTSGFYNLVGTATEDSTGAVEVVKIPFHVAELAECEGEVAPVIITLESDGAVESAPDCSVAAPDDGEVDVPVWTGLLY